MLKSLFLVAFTLLYIVTSQAPNNVTVTDVEFATPAVLMREGAVYASDDRDVVYIAGGVNFAKSSQSFTSFNNYTYTNQTGSSFTVYDDVWLFNVTTKTFFSADSTQLQNPVYFATGGWSYVRNALVLYSGRNNTAYSQSNNTYFADIQLVDHVESTNANTKVLTLTPAVTPRQFASSIIYNGMLYVFGGMTGENGTIPVPMNDRFFCVNLTTGATHALDMSGVNSPIAVINPVMFSSMTHDSIFIYSGLTADYQTFASNTSVYVFNVTANTWATPIVPGNSRGSLPNVVFPGVAHLPQFDYVMELLIGGSHGIEQVDGASSSRDMHMVMPFNFPTINVTTIPIHSISARERAMVGFNVHTNPSTFEIDIYLIGGAIYNDTLQLQRGSGMNGQVNGTMNALITPVPTYVNFTTVFKVTGAVATYNSSSSSSSTGSMVTNSSTGSITSSSSSSSMSFKSSSSSSSAIPVPEFPDNEGPSGSSSTDAATAIAVILGIIFAGLVGFLVYKKFILKPKVFVSGSEMTSPRVNRSGSIKGLVGTRGYQRTASQSRPQDEDQVLSSDDDESDLEYESGGDEEPMRKPRDNIV